MKKFLALVLAMLMVLSLVACGSKNETPATPGADPAAPAKKQSVTVATGSTSANYYAIGGVLSTVLNDKLTLSELNVTSTGASKANMQLLQDGECQLAIAQNDVSYYCYSGTALFEGETPYTDFSGVCAIYDETVQIFTLDPSIKTFSDLKGKTVSVGAAGSGDNVAADQIFKEYGMTFDDVNAVYQSYSDSAESIKDGKIDAAFCVSGAPTTALVDFAATAGKPINIISLEPEHIENLMKDYSFYAKTTIEPGTYNGLNTPVDTVSIRAQLVARNDLSEDIVYELLTQMFENLDALKAGHNKFANFDLQAATDGVSIPYHPGAVKFFTEKGINVQ